MIEECQDTGIILDRDCYGITLSANVIAHEMKCGIDLRDAHGCAVTGNSFPLVHDRGVVIGKESGRIPVVGNAFGDSYHRRRQDAAARCTTTRRAASSSKVRRT